MTKNGDSPLFQFMRLVDVVYAYRPLALAVRLEAYYQHYARHAVMDGSLSGPVPRHAWWRYVISSDPRFAARLAVEDGLVFPDAEGAIL